MFIEHTKSITVRWMSFYFSQAAIACNIQHAYATIGRCAENTYSIQTPTNIPNHRAAPEKRFQATTNTDIPNFNSLISRSTGEKCTIVALKNKIPVSYITWIKIELTVLALINGSESNADSGAHEIQFTSFSWPRIILCLAKIFASSVRFQMIIL